VVEYACGIPELLKGEVLENVARGIDCEMVRQAHGVCVGIVPYPSRFGSDVDVSVGHRLWKHLHPQAEQHELERKL
jgi:hypothetical protein